MNHKKARLLMAMPSLEGAIFSESIILLAQQDEQGALGFIINKPTGANFQTALEILKLEPIDDDSLSLLMGGPVQSDFIWVAHDSAFDGENSYIINPEMSVSPAIDVFDPMHNHSHPELYLAGVGYAGWGPGQLETELEEGSWWMAEMDIQMLLKTPAELRWKAAFKHIGADTAFLIDRTDPLDPTIN